MHKLSNNKDEIFVLQSFSRKVLFDFFFVLLVNYLLTRFILKQDIWTKIS